MSVDKSVPVFKGSAVALVTPFKKDGGVDYDALTRLIELQIVSGTDAIVVCGTTGEAATMTVDERLSTIQFVKERVNGRIPVIAGTGSNCTASAIEASRNAEAIGVDGLLVVTPYYNKTTQTGLIAHYNAIADSVDLPIIAYNVPSRTGVNILPNTMAEIMRHPNIVGIKEASGNIEQVVTLAATCPDCHLYSGNDDQILPLLALGGLGVISVVANVLPAVVHGLCEAFFSGDVAAAREAQFQMLPLCKAAFCEVNPIPVKAMLGELKLCEPDVRLPLVPPAQENLVRIREALQAYGLID